jgi:transposase InsO family protein
VEQLVESNVIKLVLAQVDVLYSNSMIEAWWRSLKHQWLYLITLDTKETVAELVGFYVTQHNIVIPHFALDGLTPDEAYFGTGANARGTIAAGWMSCERKS